MKRISEYNNITNIAENDVLPIVDVSDTEQATTGSTRKVTIEKIADYLKDWFYPVGTIYETTSPNFDTTAKMNAHFGGTWEVFGAGRVLVAKSTDAEFDTIGETGGAKTHTLTVAEMPAHGHNVTSGGVQMELGNGSSGSIGVTYGDTTGHDGWPFVAANTGGSGAHNNLQPYIVVFRYRRVS